MIERRRWRGHWKGWTGRDVSWNDNISSIKVKGGCFLKLQEHEKFTGILRQYEGGDLGESITLGDMNNKATSIECKCGGLVFDI